jgi:hypothetical protein
VAIETRRPENPTPFSGEPSMQPASYFFYLRRDQYAARSRFIGDVEP